MEIVMAYRSLLISVYSKFGSEWDIKFNPTKSQITTFGGANPHLNTE